MTVEIIKVYKEHVPPARLIGKRYTEEDRNAMGSFADQWQTWFANDWFEEIAKLGTLQEVQRSSFGMMRMTGNQFEYWIGMLFPQDTEVPAGFRHADLADADVGICWIYGNADSGELYGLEPHNQCMAKFDEQGWQMDENAWFFERYHETRFTSADEKGNVVLDYGVYLK